MNHDDLIVPYLKNQLVPKGTLPVVGIGWNDSTMSTAFYNVSFIHAACDELGRRLKSHVTDPITPLEKLAIELLLASAYISDFDDRVRALASFRKHLAENPSDE